MTEETHQVCCATCGAPVDAWRAAQVRFTERQQWFFCSSAHADVFDVNTQTRKLPDPKPLIIPTNKSRVQGPSEPSPHTEESTGLGGLLTAPLPYSPLASDTLRQPDDARSKQTPSIDRSEADSPFDVLILWAPPALTLIGGGYAAALGEPFYEPLLAGIILLLAALWGRRQTQLWKAERTVTREAYERRLQTDGDRVTSTGTAKVLAPDLRPGEEVIVRPGGYVPADGVVSQGEAEVDPWEGSSQTISIQGGDRIVAGARVLSGELRITCSKTGEERAFSPQTLHGKVALTERLQATRIGRQLTSTGAFLVGLLGALLCLLRGESVPTGIVALGSIWASLSHPIARALPSVVAHHWLIWAARQGICFSHGQLVDRAGTATVAAFCARGTVLHGEPEVAEVHPLRGVSERDILSLAAGAESVVHHPVAAAVLRATRARDIVVDSCRSHNATPGMGVRCTSSSGDYLVLGSRELLLREKLSIAMAEETLRALESRGLTAFLLARNGHLIGIIALQDSLRAGAKAAVQLLLDERIEPVLISADARVATEAVARALAIEHVRPEIPTGGRAREVQNLIEGGATVAVIGTSPRDDAALGAAPVPIVLDGASISWRAATHGRERAIGLATTKVIAASLALIAAKRIRILGGRALLISLLPSAVIVATTMARLTPQFLPPLVASLSAIVAMRFAVRRP